MKSTLPNPNDAYSRDWISRIIAALILGFTLALGCTWIFVLFAGEMAVNARIMLVIWLFMPIWLGVLGCCWLYSSGWQTWRSLGIANLIVFAVVGVLHLIPH